QAGLLVVAVRIGLWLLPFSVMLRLMNRFGDAPATGKADARAVRKAASAVAATSRYVPYATCLTQAMATRVLLGRLGPHSPLRIGVVRSARGRLEAHAWVESGGTIIVGAVSDLARFSALSQHGDRLQ